ncbi:unnamed protein product [Rotaria sp. Silwood1]|nr:unnamed protein product [Rotaria sp. Silwood1]CAF5020674.1 unnamed protein product [Rotaria sp. Silwood1]
MGSPLAPLLAEIFLQDFEKKHLPSFKEKGIVYWKRYVDDTFVLLDPKVSAKEIAAQLSQCHPSLKFTCEEEYTTINKDLSKEGSSQKKFTHKNQYTAEKKRSTEEKKSTPRIALSFLDVLVERQPNIGFESRKYRKETFTGLLTKWDSFVPKQYKYNAISTMVYRATRICSTYEALHDEFDIIRGLALDNGYPVAFVESIIRRQLNLIYTPPAITPTEPETDTVVLRVPYYGKPSQTYAKRVTAAVAKQYPLKQVRVVYDVTARIGQNFTTKDQIPTELKSGVVYEATCPQCKEQYIGKTCRHLKTRMNEHLSEQKKLLPPPVQEPEPKLNSKLSSKKVVGNHNLHMMMTRSKARMIKHETKQRKLLPKALTESANSQQQIETPNKTTTETKVHITRSKTRKKSSIKPDPKKLDPDEILQQGIPVDKTANQMIPKSALTKHFVSTGHAFTTNDFNILLSDRHRYRLLIKESILIRQREPKLNGTDRSIPLYIFPDGIPKNANKAYTQATRPPDNHTDTGMQAKFFSKQI